MATIEKLTIQFEGKGAPKLTGQLNSLSAAMNKLAARQVEVTKKTKAASKATDSYNERMTKTGRNVAGLEGTFGKFGKTMSQMRSKMLIVAFAFGVVAKVVGAMHKAVSEFQVAQGKLNGVIASTGAAAGKTSTQLAAMADSIQVSMGISNSKVMEMQGRLLTFTSIVGRQFDKTSKIIVDMSSVLGTDLNSSVIQVGKALNDPIKGLTSLSRVGVSFTNQQKEQIKTLQESGNIIGAQKVILNELQTEFGGATDAIRANAKSTQVMTDLSNEFGDAIRAVGEYVGQGFVIMLGQAAREVVSWVQKTADALIATQNWFAILADTGTIFQENIRLQDAMSEAAANASTQFTKFRVALGGYSEEIQAAAMANENFTNIEQLQMYAQLAAQAVTEDKRKEHLDALAEAILTNNNLLNANKTSIDAYNESINQSVSSLEFQLAQLQATSEEEKMALKITKDRLNGVVDINAALSELTLDERNLITEIIAEKDAQEQATQAAKDKAKADREAAAEIVKNEKAATSNTKSLMARFDAQQRVLAGADKITEVEKLQSITTRTVTDDEIAYAKALDEVNRLLKEKKEATDEATQADKDAAELSKNREEVRKEMIDQGMEMLSQWSQNQIDSTKAVAEAQIEAINEAMNFELDSLRQSTAFRLSNDKQKEKAQKKIRDKAKKDEEIVRKAANDKMKDQFKIQQAVQISETIMATSLAVMKTLAKGSGFFSTPLAMAVAGMGAANVAMIASQKPPTMKYGGLIGGQPHSRGGTMIEAERGEFVMSKKAVDAVGLETMNRINAGGSSADVNISFAGNVMSKDFIEDEAIPQIKEALRRGGDIGVG